VGGWQFANDISRDNAMRQVQIDGNVKIEGQDLEMVTIIA
jgi:hypothetical protein